MRTKQPHPSAANVVPFPEHLIGVKRQSDGTRAGTLPLRRGTLDVFVGENGMVLIDACLPADVASRVVATLRADVSVDVN